MTKRQRKSPARGVYWDGTVYRTDMRLSRLRGGRLVISLQTTVAKEAESAAAAIRTLYHRGEYAALERLRSGELSIGDLRAAAATGNFDRLRVAHDDTATLGQARDWILSEVADNRPKSVEKYTTIARALIGKFGEDTRLADIDGDALLEWLREPKPKYKRPWSAAQRHQVHIVCKRMWRVADRRAALRARELGLTHDPMPNPWADIPRPKVRPTRLIYLSPEEWRAIATNNKGLARLALVAVLTFAGLRLSEAGHLRNGLDVDLDERVIRVQPRAGRYPWSIKNDRRRVIPMSKELHRILADHVELGYAGGTYLIRSPDRDAPLHLSTLIRWVMLAFQAGGVTYGRDAEKGMTAHACRHTFATTLLLRRVPIHVVADLMGDDAKTVLKTYAHMLPLDREAAIRELDETFT